MIIKSEQVMNIITCVVGIEQVMNIITCVVGIAIGNQVDNTLAMETCVHLFQSKS
jgi:hypothetical protein